MDGTLVDTEPYWIATEKALALEHGRVWTDEQALQLVGNDLLVSGQTMVDQLDLPLTAAQVVDRLLDGVVAAVQRSVPWRPGARELLAALRDDGVPCALVTMSWVRFVDPILAALPEGSFDAVVTGDAVAHGKPHPEPYLAAARALGVAPSSCLAIEDSETGARSAGAAGCGVLVVPHHVPVPPEPGRVFRDSLAGLTTSDLGALHGESRSGRVG